MAGRPAHVLLFLPLDVEQVLAGADAERVAHDVHRRVRGDRRLGQAGDRIDQDRAVEGDALVLERLQEALARRGPTSTDTAT